MPYTISINDNSAILYRQEQRMKKGGWDIIHTPVESAAGNSSHIQEFINKKKKEKDVIKVYGGYRMKALRKREHYPK